MASGSRANVVREAIEAELADSFASALSPKPCVQRPLLPFHVGALDALTSGGAPAGAVTELVGLGSTGKTGAAMRLLAGAMRVGKVCAWVDASDTFDPQTAAANGMPLPQLLWVRCGAPAQPAPETAARAAMERTGPPMESKGTHPRDEARGLDLAVGGLFAAARASTIGAASSLRDAGTPAAPARVASHGSDRNPEDWPDASRTGMHSTRNRQGLGTPGAPNRPLSPYKRAPHTPRPAFRPVPRSEQVAEDRMPGRSAASGSGSVPGGGPAPLGEPKQMPRQTPDRISDRTSDRPWQRLDQALRAADLLLQGGGFGAVVLDLGSVAPEHALRIPAATWFRFRAAAEASGTAFVLLSQAPCARSSARLVLHFEPLRVRLAGGTVVETMEYGAAIARQRFVSAEEDGPPRKQPKAVWQASSYAGAADAGSGAEPVRLLAPVLAWRAKMPASAQGGL